MLMVLDFLRKNNWAIRKLRRNTSYTYARGFNGKYLVNAAISKKVIKFFANFTKEIDIYLMVKEAVYF